MAETSSEQLKILNEAIRTSELKKIIKISEQLRNDENYEEISIHCHGLALMKLKRYAEAISFISESKYSDLLEPLKMYCHLKTKNYSEIIQTYSNRAKLNNIEEELTFLALFYKFEFNEALKHASSHEKEYACKAGISLYKNSVDFIDNFDTKIENMFNKLCFLIGSHRFIDANQMIETIYNENHSNISDNLRLQSNYLAFFTETPFKDNIGKKLNDIFRLININNSICINKNMSWFEKKKKIKMIDQCLDSETPVYLSRTISFNKFLIYFFANDKVKANDEFDKYSHNFDENDILRVLMSFYLKNDLQILLSSCHYALNVDQKPNLMFNLLIFENLKNINKINECVALLRKLSVFYDIPILIAFAFDFISEHVSVSSAIDFLQQKIETQEMKNPYLMYLLCLSFTKIRDFESARRYIFQLKSLDQTLDSSVLAIIKLYDYIDSSSSQSYIGLKPSDLGLTLSEVEQVEASISNYRSKNKKTNETDKIEIVKKKRKRKGKLPKHYDPTIPPDPERWSPKHQRTGYKPRKKDKGKKGMHQGSSSSAKIKETTVSAPVAPRYNKSKTRGKSKHPRRR